MLSFFGGPSIVRIGTVIDKMAVAIDDVRSPTMDGGPGLWKRYEPRWEISREKMYRTKGRHTGARWKPYQTRRKRGGERVYVAIKRSIYARHGKKFHPERELLRWIRGRELLYPSLAQWSPFRIYQPHARHLIVGTELDYAKRLGKRRRIPRRLGGGRHPARPLLKIEGDSLKDLRRTVLQYAVAHQQGLARELNRTAVEKTGGARQAADWVQTEI